MDRVQLPGVSEEERTRLDWIKDRWQWQAGFALRVAEVMLARGGRPYSQSVPAAEVARRRARNKRARKARRVNRCR